MEHLGHGRRRTPLVSVEEVVDVAIQLVELALLRGCCMVALLGDVLSKELLVSLCRLFVSLPQNVPVSGPNTA